MAITSANYWLRGAIKIRNSQVRLIADRTERYWLHRAHNLAFEIAALSSDFSNPNVERFAVKFGLLRSHESAELEWEDLGEWKQVSHRLALQLELYRLLQSPLQAWYPRRRTGRKERMEWNSLEDRAAAGHDSSSVVVEREALIDVLHQLGTSVEHSLPDLELVGYASQVLADEINLHLEKIHVRVLPSTATQGMRRPIFFDRDVETDSLLGVAYYEFEDIVHYFQPIDRCLECKKFFDVIDGRMKFCCPRCSGNARSRRYYQNKSGGDEENIPV